MWTYLLGLAESRHTSRTPRAESMWYKDRKGASHSEGRGFLDVDQ